MAYWDESTPNETKCQINEVTDIECDGDTECDVYIPAPFLNTIHVCAEHYELALKIAEEIGAQ